MGFAIVGYFDFVSDEKVKTIWKGLANINVDDYLIKSENNPHIKFAMFNTLDLLATKRALQLLTKRTTKIDIHFKKYGLYPNDKPFLTIDIADNVNIMRLHNEIQDIFKGFGEEDGRGYFSPGIWKPDCQLTVSFDKTKLPAAVNYLADINLPFNGKLERLGVIEYYPAKQLFSYPLT